MNRQTKHTAMVCGLLIISAFFLTFLQGCTNSNPTPTPNVPEESQLPSVEEVKTIQANYITAEEAEQKVLSKIADYKPEVPTISGDTEVEDSDTVETSENSKILSVKPIAELINSDFHMGDDFCQKYNETVECLYFPDDAFYVFSIFDEYTTETGTYSVPAEKYDRIEFHVNKLSGEVIELGRFMWESKIEESQYQSAAGDIISISPSDEDMRISFKSANETNPIDFEGLAIKSNISNRYDLTLGEDTVTFILDGDNLKVRSSGTGDIIVIMIGNYIKI